MHGVLVDTLIRVDGPNLDLSTPELIHASERIGILKFKLVPRSKRSAGVPTRVRFLELPQCSWVPKFETQKPKLKSLQRRLNLKQGEGPFLNMK